MRVIRYESGAGPRYGVVEGAEMHALAHGLDAPATGQRVAALADVVLLAPCDPRIIVCAGANYASQLVGTGRSRPSRPPLFLKAVNTVTGPGTSIERPAELGRLEYEGELAVVMSRTARDVRRDDVASYVLGYTCANDVTAHDWRADGQWTRAKSLDTFCPLGPWVETAITDPGDLRLRTRLNRRTVQDCSTSDMVFDVGELIAWITRWITLGPGDVVLTGSPGGVGAMVVGDVVEVDIEGIGILTNSVERRTPTAVSLPPEHPGGSS